MDRKIFSFLNGLIGRSAVSDELIKIIAVYLIYAIPLFLLIYWFLGNKKTVLRAFISGVLAWQGFAKLIGHFYFRPRPLSVFPSKELIFHRPDYSFPSDHASFLFGVAFAFYLCGEKKISYYLFAVSIIITIGRVIVGFHYPTDILAGAILGILVAWIVWLIRREVDKWVTNPIIFVAKKIKLA